MAVRPTVPAVAVALLLAPLVATQPAQAATVLGTADLAGPGDGFACAGCAGGTTIGFRQLALQGATVEAPEAGVLVSAGAYLRRIGGTGQAQIAVLRPAGGIRATIAGKAALPVSSPGGAPAQVDDLHLPVLPGDSLGVLLPAGQVDLGFTRLASPDGAVVTFALPCTLCGTDGGTGRELLFQGRIEPDADEDLLGDESQDPDAGLASDEEPSSDDEELFDEEPGAGARPRRRGRLRLLRAVPGCGGGATLVVAAPGPGRLAATATTVPLRRRHRSRPRRLAPGRTVAAGRARATRAGRVRLQLHPGPRGRRLLARRGRLRTRVEVSFSPRSGRSLTVTDVLLRLRTCRHQG